MRLSHLRFGDSINRMTALFGGHVRFFGITFGRWGFGFISWNPKESLARAADDS